MASYREAYLPHDGAVERPCCRGQHSAASTAQSRPAQAASPSHLGGLYIAYVAARQKGSPSWIPQKRLIVPVQDATYPYRPACSSKSPPHCMKAGDQGTGIPSLTKILCIKSNQRKRTAGSTSLQMGLFSPQRPRVCDGAEPDTRASTRPALIPVDLWALPLTLDGPRFQPLIISTQAVHSIPSRPLDRQWR